MPRRSRRQAENNNVPVRRSSRQRQRREQAENNNVPVRSSGQQRQRREHSTSRSRAPRVSNSSASSIRENARNRSSSRGERSSAYYSLGYHPSQRERSQIISNPRICICDQPSIPPSCTNGCNIEDNNRCQEHELVSCSSNDCQRNFHRGCLASLAFTSTDAVSSLYLCMPCEEATVPAPTAWDGLRSLEKKLNRYGLSYSEDRSFRDKQRNRMNKIRTVLDECDVEPEIKNAFANNDPKPYPTAMKMNPESKTRHVLAGRRFEVSMFMYEVQQCTCCGRVQPGHVDPSFPKDCPLDRKHLMNQTHKAWHCSCDAFCKGSQFYGKDKKTEIDLYRRNHDGQSPWEFLQIDEAQPNAILCDTCYNEITPKNVDDLQHARIFSRRNGFGPSIVYPALSDNEDINVTNARKLYNLLSSFTPAEEAAIRQITPLLSIVRLAHGNIGTKGNTSCVWQESKMATILPNLPSECKFIVVTRPQRPQERGSENLIRSTKFKRQKIQDCLEILCSTVEGVWKDKRVCPERLNQWPEEGDLLELNDTLRIFERDDEGNMVDITNEDEGNVVDRTNDDEGNVVDRTNDQRGSIELDTDGDDAGPAPLQNGVAPDETFEGVINMNDSNISNGGNAILAAQRIRDAVQTIWNEGVFSRNRESVTFAQEAILPQTNEFVNMNTTSYVWARAFPTVFIPVYTNWRGEMKWVIFNDITGSDGIREKKVPIQKWYNYTMWRSDGIPASHPTFSLILYNHKIRNSLQSQGRFTINTSDFDPTITLDSIRNASRDDDLTVATEALLKRAHMHVSNIPGTTPYWKGARHEFKAINFFNSYINKKEVSLFHTGSLAEYHEFFFF